MTRSPHARWWAMGATALTVFVVGLDMTVLNVALPTIAVDLHAASRSSSGSSTPTRW